MTYVHAGSEQLGGPIRLEYRPYATPFFIEGIFVGVKHIKRALLRCLGDVVERKRREHSRFLHDAKVLASGQTCRRIQRLGVIESISQIGRASCRERA